MPNESCPTLFLVLCLTNNTWISPTRSRASLYCVVLHVWTFVLDMPCLSTTSMSYSNTVDSINFPGIFSSGGNGTLLVCATKHVSADSNKNRKKIPYSSFGSVKPRTGVCPCFNSRSRPYNIRTVCMFVRTRSISLLQFVVRVCILDIVYSMFYWYTRLPVCLT